MKPTVGRVVLFKAHNSELTGGNNEVPALVTHVWSDTCINVMVMRDGHEATPIGVTSVSMTDDFAASGQACAWRWMPYQKAVAAGEIEPLKHA